MSAGGQEPDNFISTSSRDARAVEVLNEIFVDAANQGASDVHFEDFDGGMRIRFRLNGSLHEHITVDRSTSLDMEAKIRMRAKLSLTERRGGLDGRLFLRIEDRTVDVRVSILPIQTGQSIVCRLLDQANATRKLEDIHMFPSVRVALEQQLANPDGLVLVTGPTGSGKTSTLYAVLNNLNNIDTKIITVEDPVEYRLELACQVGIQRGMTFGSALRSILRQDPDIILVGEIRDAETAKIALQAAMTGHLVMSTLHANSAPTTLTRMVDLGVDPYTLGAALRCVIAQRLVRKLCSCATPVEVDETTQAWLTKHSIDWEGKQYFGPVGCPECHGSGYKGRLPVMEMIVSSKEVRAAVDKNDRHAILAAARMQPQFETLGESAVRMCSEGLTSLMEAQRIASDDLAEDPVAAVQELSVDEPLAGEPL